MQLRNAIKHTKQLINFWLSLVGVASITAIVWYFDPIGDLPAKIVLTLLATAMSFLSLVDGLSNDERRRKFSWDVFWFVAFSIGALLILFGDKFDAPGLVINVASLLAAVPALWLYWKVAQDELLLKLWLSPIIVSASLYLVPPVTPAGVTFDLLFLPLPVVSYACVAWALATKWSLTRARRLQCCDIWGPGMQSLTMFLLVVPLVALTMLAVNALRFDDVWVAVSGAIVGILFGGAVSQPLRKLLLDLGDLSPKTKCEGGVETK